MLHTNHQQNILLIVETIMNTLEYVINKRAKAIIEHDKSNQSLKCVERFLSLYNKNDRE